QPRAQVTVLGVLHREAVSHARPLDLGEAIQHAQRTRLTRQHLREVRFAQPRRYAVADLDADLRRETVAGNWSSEIHLAETSLADEAIQAVRPSGFGAVGRADPSPRASLRFGVMAGVPGGGPPVLGRLGH